MSTPRGPDCIPGLGGLRIDGFAAGLGHELSNVVAALRIRLSCLQDGVAGPAPNEDLRALEAAVEQAGRIAEGLRFLAAHGHCDVVERAPVQSWWLATVPLLRAIAPRGLRIEKDVEGHAAGVEVAPSPLTAVVFVVVEAVCGSPDAPGGHLEVRVPDGRSCIEVAASSCRSAGGTPVLERLPQGLRERIAREGGEIVFGSDGGQERVMLRFPAAASGAGAGPLPRVFVGVEDDRKRAMILAELRALACQITSDPTERPGCEVEIVDDRTWGPGRPGKVVLLADGGPRDEGAHTIGKNPTVGALRLTLRRVLQESR